MRAKVIELTMVFVGLWVLYWQLMGPVWRGLLVFGGASGVAIGLMLLYEDFVKPGE